MSTFPFGKPSFSFVTLDVFTTTPFAGNQLAVVVIPPDQHDTLTTAQMQAVTREFNFSETVFLFQRASHAATDVPEWRIRIFFPKHELAFAGHPTIGTAVYALGTLLKGANKGRLLCNAGPIELEFFPKEQRARASIPHNFHRHTEAEFTREQVYASQPKLKDAGIELRNVNVLSSVKGMNIVAVELADLNALEQLYVSGIPARPKLDTEWDVGHGSTYWYVFLDRGGADRPAVLRTRMMEGTLEDPATGSAACALSCVIIPLRPLSN